MVGIGDKLMVSFNLQVAKNQNDLAELTTQIISQEITHVLKNKDRFQIALSGGSTPSKAYSMLGEKILPWHRVDVFLGDERWVSSSHESSNALMLKNTLLASEPGSKACFHSVKTVELKSPEESADEFSKVLLKICKGNPPRFDFVLLGLGEDGHTASLFPGTPSLKVNDSLTTVGRGKGQERITLTANVLSAASKVVFLVSGENKSRALKRLLDPSEDYERTPAKLIRPSSQVIVLADEAAVGIL